MMIILRNCAALFFIILLAGCAPDDGTNAVKHIDQNISAYIDSENQKNTVISLQKQKQFTNDYLERYYLPWNTEYSTEFINKLKKEQQATIDYYLLNPGFREHEQPIKMDWVEHIQDKMGFEDYPNKGIKAITLRNTNIRVLPTNKASYKSQKLVGEGYPFDYLQQSLIPANIPIYVIHQSKNKSWSFIICHYATGWVKSSHIAYVDNEFIKNWKSDTYITPTVLDFCVNESTTSRFLFYARLGAIFPVSKKNAKSYEIKVTQANKNEDFATIKTSVISNKDASLWPLFPSTKNFNQIISTLIGQPYGWGGLFGYRDCSSTIMDIYASFGIWLPRETKQQASSGKYTSFNDLTKKDKLKLLDKNATPLLTLINIEGHILLYLGKKNNEFYVLQDVWGLHTGTKFKETGRSIIAKTIITPVTFGEKYFNVPKSDIERAYSMTTIAIPVQSQTTHY